MSQIELPQSWKWVRLTNVTEVVGGGTPSRNTQRYFGGNIPWATPTDVTSLDNIYLTDTAETITEEGLNNSSTKLLPAGSVLLTSRATIGVTAIATRPMTTNQGFINLICNNNLIESEYLARYLAWAKEMLIRLAHGTTFKEISRSALRRFEIPLPTLSEQREIVKILRQADHLRQLRVDADRRTEELALATFNNLFGFIDKDAPYPQVRLGKVSEIVSGVTKGRNLPTHETINVPYLRVANVQAGYLDLSEVKMIDVLPADVEKYALERDDILLTEGGDFDKLGRGAIWEQDIPNCIHQNHVFRVRVNQETLLPLFLNYYLQTTFAKHYFLRAAKRTTNLASINLSQLSALPIFLPSLEMQQKFVNAVNQIRSLLATQKLSSVEIDRLSRSAMINAFTGRLTENYRQQNLVELTRLANERDFALSHSTSTEPREETAQVQKRSSIEFSLSPSQHELLTFIEEQSSYITNDNLEIGSKLSPNEIRRDLDLLAQLGLIKVTQIAVTPGELGRIFFTKVYRALHPEDDVRETDLAILSETSQQ